MNIISDMQIFTRIVSAGSLTAAGRDLGLSTGAISQRLKALEDHHKVPLLTRSTRAITLTPEGELYLRTANRVLAELNKLDAALGGTTGRLRIAAPNDLGRTLVGRLLHDFRAAHGEVAVELHLSDDLTELLGGEFDVAFRYGNLQDSSLIARPLAPNRRVVVASPAYIAAHGRPEHPEDLARHTCLLLSRSGERMDRWTFVKDGREIAIRLNAMLVTNDGALLKDWAVSGCGIVRKSLIDVRDELADGRLVELLPDFPSPPVGLNLVYPANRRHIARVRNFIRFTTEFFRRTIGTDPPPDERHVRSDQNNQP